MNSEQEMTEKIGNLSAEDLARSRAGKSLAGATLRDETLNWASQDSSSENDRKLAAALEEYLEALKSDSELTREQFLSRHPSIASELNDCLSGLHFIQSAGWHLNELDEPSGDGPADARAGEQGPEHARLGDYRIIRELGRGSMGVVYEAQQISLNRRVALKVLPFASAIDPRQRQRFMIEAQAAAQLHHPHIVPIHAAGCDQGVHFYAMQFIEGQSLAQLIHKYRKEREAEPSQSPRPPDDSTSLAPGTVAIDALQDTSISETSDSRPTANSVSDSGVTSGQTGLQVQARLQARARIAEVARLGRQAAEGLDHAHALGVLHRDIKPANLLVDHQGELWIADFGLARFRGDLSLTQSGDLIGTLRYMSPEQALAGRGSIDPRADVYSLGLTIYEMLALRPAFDGRDHQELLRQVAFDDPVPLRKIDPTIPRDLETIVMKAGCKEASGRYASAKELAEDLGRFLNDQPILARRPTLFERTYRWAKRHRQMVLTASAVLILAVISGALIFAYQGKRTREDLQHYIKKSFPAIDSITMIAMQQASSSPEGMGLGSQIQQEQRSQVYSRALDFYRTAAELPPTDLGSRVIIGRALFRMGFTHAVLGYVMSKSMYSEEKSFEHEKDAQHFYGEAIVLFEKLLKESPTDNDVRSHFADALGEWGYGWYLRGTNRPNEGEKHFHRAIALRREIVNDPASDPLLVAEELVKLASLSIQVAAILDSSGRADEAAELRRANAAACTALGSRITDSDVRTKVADPLGQYGLSLVVDERPKIGLEVLNLSLLIDPNHPIFLNDKAWAIVSHPGGSPEEIKVAIEAIEKAIKIQPLNWAFWNTLGVAHYRNGDWAAAAESIAKSMELQKGGEAADWFFMAMIRQHEGQPAEARTWYDRAVEWKNKNRPIDPELIRFQKEAEAILGIATDPTAEKAAAEQSPR